MPGIMPHLGYGMPTATPQTPGTLNNLSPQFLRLIQQINAGGGPGSMPYNPAPMPGQMGGVGMPNMPQQFGAPGGPAGMTPGRPVGMPSQMPGAAMPGGFSGNGVQMGQIPQGGYGPLGGPAPNQSIMSGAGPSGAPVTSSAQAPAGFLSPSMLAQFPGLLAMMGRTSRPMM